LRQFKIVIVRYHWRAFTLKTGVHLFAELHRFLAEIFHLLQVLSNRFHYPSDLPLIFEKTIKGKDHLLKLRIRDKTIVVIVIIGITVIPKCIRVKAESPVSVLMFDTKA